MFEDLGDQMVKETTKATLQKGLGKLGGMLGIHMPEGKPDGTTGKPFHVIVDGQGDSSSSDSENVVPGGGLKALGGFLGKIGGGIGGLFGGLKGLFSGAGAAATESVSSSISFLADGGDADPGKVYGVAEAGEGEFITPRNASTVTPLSKMNLGGNTTIYQVNAPGAEIGAWNRISRGLEATHDSAVSTSVRANAERAKRTPQRGR